MGHTQKGAQPLVVAIGEALWDILPQRKSPGGAPANFAFHCSQLQVAAYLVSEIGDDDLGNEMKSVFTEMGLNTDFLSVNEDYPTGSVSVRLDTGQNPRYEIREDVAWDYIRWSPQLENLAQNADVVCFGSLAQRSPVSRRTICRFLECTDPNCLRVFDINLREPYIDPAVLLASLKKANVLKLNIEELDYLSTMLRLTGNLPHRLTSLLHVFDLFCVVLTLGAQGSILATSTETVECPGLKIDIQDTVGAGDAFAAAVTIGLLERRPLHEINAMATRIAAYVCTQAGAMINLPKNVLQAVRSGGMPIREYRPRTAISDNLPSVSDKDGR